MNRTHTNKSFHAAAPSWANACVGDNGEPDIFEYACGFASAAKVLLDDVIACKGVDLKVDTLVYPICFSMRHSIELFLKASTVTIAKIAKIRGEHLPAFDFAASHDLGKIWSYVQEHALKTDERFTKPIVELDEYIRDVSLIDATGQVFRYPFGADNSKHLTEISVINLLVLKQRFNEAERLLRTLDRLSEQLHEEYRWGTFTRSLSRHQLCQIARRLPARDTWKSESFRDVKNGLKAKYSLSSNELCKALNLIQSRHEMAACIGIQIPIPGLRIEALQRFFDRWSQVNTLNDVITQPPPKIINSDDFFECMQSHSELQAIAKELAHELRCEEFSVIEALFNFENEAPISEAFERLLMIHQKNVRFYEIDAEKYQGALMKKIASSRAFERVLYALDMLGQIDVLEVVIDRYGLTSARDRLLERSTRYKNLA